MTGETSEQAIHEKTRMLDRLLDSYGSLLVAFSGGADSTFLLHRAISRLSAARVTATYLDSFLQPDGEKKNVEEVALRIGAELLILPVEIELHEKVIRNGSDRCYHCKKVMFGSLFEIARERNIDVVAEGTNLDDLNDYRPGRRAVSESGAVSPLLEARFMKHEILGLMKKIDLPGWNRGPSTCLASRVQYGEILSSPLLKRIGEFELFLSELGFSGVRVRIHKNLVRLEVDPEQVERVASAEMRKLINEYASASGFDYATLDLSGYRTGSMNVF